MPIPSRWMRRVMSTASEWYFSSSSWAAARSGNSGTDRVDIVQWAKRMTNCSRENIGRIADPRLSTLPIDEAMHVFFISMLCVQENSIERPTMREVVQMLCELPHRVTEGQSPSSSVPRQEESSSPSKETNCYKLFPDLLT